MRSIHPSKSFGAETMWGLLVIAFLGLFSVCGRGAQTNAVMAAAEARQWNRMVELVNEGGDVHGRDRHGHTPLIMAVWSGQTGAVKRLLTAGSAVEARDDFGNTALITGAAAGFPRVVELLLEGGAMADATNARGETALMRAVAMTNLRSKEQSILSGTDGHKRYGALMVDTSPMGERMLEYVLSADYREVVKILVAHGADVNLRDRYGNSALSKAIFRGNLTLACFLVEKGADVNGRHVGGLTPLMFAVLDGRPSIVQYLLEHGADPDTPADRGLTARTLAAESKEIELIRIFERIPSKR